MTVTRIQRTAPVLIATMALAATALGIAAAPPVAAGLRNCVDVTGTQIGRVGCYENVWADGVEYRMTFSNQQFAGAAPHELDAFYVIAPQTETPQGAPPATFPHDHVVRDVPRQNHGGYSVQLQGFFVLCSEEGISTGACEPTGTSVAPGAPPLLLAKTVNGQPLTSVEPIEAAAAAGLITLSDLGPGARIVGTISGN